MAKSKYYYVILNKENGRPFLDCERLPIFYNKKVAQNTLTSFDKKYSVFRIEISEMEKLFLKSTK